MKSLRSPKRPIDLSDDDNKASSSAQPPAKRRLQPPKPSPPPSAANVSSEEEDYMTFLPPSPPRSSRAETLTERQRRIQREREVRRPKSKAELAREEAEKREAALATSLLESATENRGLAMMRKMGFKTGEGLGRSVVDEARLEPVGVKIRMGRGGVGHESEEMKRIRERAGGVAAVGGGVDPEGYRERVRVERQERKAEGMFYAAQKVCEKLDMYSEFGVEEADIGKERSVSLKAVNVLWRGAVVHRENMAAEMRMKYDMLQGEDRPRLPGYEKDEEERIAIGGKAERRLYEEDTAEAEGEEDVELKEFEEKSWKERLDMIVSYLREKHRYCFWCKFQYGDEEMDGCPGIDEELHG